MTDRLWSVNGERLQPLDHLAEDDALGDHVLVLEYRPPCAEDIPNMAHPIAEAVQEWLVEEFNTDDGDGPELDQAAFADDIRSTLRAALAAHTDLSKAAWQKTGRTTTLGEARTALWHDDGTPRSNAASGAEGGAVRPP